jgi:hypothetical protein
LYQSIPIDLINYLAEIQAGENRKQSRKTPIKQRYVLSDTVNYS